MVVKTSSHKYIDGSKKSSHTRIQMVVKKSSHKYTDESKKNPHTSIQMVVKNPHTQGYRW